MMKRMTTPMRTVNDFMKAYDYWIVSTFGYELAVRIEDFLFGLSMINMCIPCYSRSSLNQVYL